MGINVKLGGMFIIIATLILAQETSAATTWEVNWTKGVNFQEWAATTDMKPGDKLLFKYPPGSESVMEVDKPSYEQCGRPADVKYYNTGNDEILLDKPGPKYFTSGCPWTCKDGMKLQIVVKDDHGTNTPVKATTQTKIVEIGGSHGWAKGFNYQEWVNNFDWYPGDTLVFKYPPGSESVMEVDLKSFEQCTRPPNAKVLNTGNDEIVLDNSGQKYFTSGCPWTCKDGMRFEITVLRDGVVKTPVQGARKLVEKH